jgi:hypothetical protein
MREMFYYARELKKKDGAKRDVEAIRYDGKYKGIIAL